MTFVDMIDNIQSTASRMLTNWGDQFEVDELVNEAWIRSLKNNHVDPPLIMRAAQFDMIDYIRIHVGRKGYTYKGKWVEPRKIPKLKTNFDTPNIINNAWEHVSGRSIFDKKYHDKGLKRLENDEFIVKILLNKTTTRRAEAMIGYYLEGNNLAETGKLMSIGEGNVCSLLKAGRSDCLSAIKEMDLENVAI